MQMTMVTILTSSVCSKDSVLCPSKVINFGDKGGHGVRRHSKGLDNRSIIEEAASNLQESSNYRAKNQSGEGAASMISMSLHSEWIYVRSLQSWGKQQVHVDSVGSCGSCYEAFSIVVQPTYAALQGVLYSCAEEQTGWLHVHLQWLTKKLSFSLWWSESWPKCFQWLWTF